MFAIKIIQPIIQQRHNNTGMWQEDTFEPIIMMVFMPIAHSFEFRTTRAPRMRTAYEYQVRQQGATSTYCFFAFFLKFFHHFYFPAQLVGGFTLSDLLDRPWSQVSSLLPPGTCLQFLSRIGFSIPTARRFSLNVANSRSRAFRYPFCMQEKITTSMSTRWELNSRNWF